jgi:hypothetical protein
MTPRAVAGAVSSPLGSVQSQKQNQNSARAPSRLELASLGVLAVSPANAKGCLKSAVVGGTAGHFAGHHGVLGAAAGCLIGRHEASKRARTQGQTDGANQERRNDPNRI